PLALFSTYPPFRALSSLHYPCTFPVALAYLFPFFCNDPATTEIYTLSLHDALPISLARRRPASRYSSSSSAGRSQACTSLTRSLDRKSTRLNSSHVSISYAVFCLKKKKKNATDNAAWMRSYQDEDGYWKQSDVVEEI